MSIVPMVWYIHNKYVVRYRSYWRHFTVWWKIHYGVLGILSIVPLKYSYPCAYGEVVGMAAADANNEKEAPTRLRPPAATLFSECGFEGINNGFFCCERKLILPSRGNEIFLDSASRRLIRVRFFQLSRCLSSHFPMGLSC